MKIIIIILLTMGTFLSSYSQNQKVIEIDPITDMAKESLPFDQGFVLKKTFQDSLSIYSIGYYEIKTNEIKTYFDYAKQPTKDSLRYIFIKNDEKFELYIFVPPLKPQRFYDFIIAQNLLPNDPLISKYLNLFDNFNKNKPMKDILIIIESINSYKQQKFDAFEHYDNLMAASPQVDTQGLKKFYENKLKSIYNTSSTEAVKKMKIIKAIINDDLFKKSVSFSSTSEVFSFETRAKLRVTPDFGYLGYGFQKDFNGITPYLGFQIEFRYFDKNIPFQLIPNKTIGHRLSFFSGVTLASLKKENKREDFFSNKSLISGLGFRLSNALRITGGAILFNREDYNPLVDNKKLTLTPCLGLSIDLSIKQLLNDVSGLIPLNRN
jgi:hypothetical protein